MEVGEKYSDDEIGDKKHVELEDDISAGEEKCSSAHALRQ